MALLCQSSKATGVPPLFRLGNSAKKPPFNGKPAQTPIIHQSLSPSVNNAVTPSHRKKYFFIHFQCFIHMERSLHSCSASGCASRTGRQGQQQAEGMQHGYPSNVSLAALFAEWPNTHGPDPAAGAQCAGTGRHGATRTTGAERDTALGHKISDIDKRKLRHRHHGWCEGIH